MHLPPKARPIQVGEVISSDPYGMQSVLMPGALSPIDRCVGFGSYETGDLVPVGYVRDNSQLPHILVQGRGAHLGPNPYAKTAWSYHGHDVGRSFWTGSTTDPVPTFGGAAVTLRASSGNIGLALSDGKKVFYVEQVGPAYTLFSVPRTGGAPTALCTLSHSEGDVVALDGATVYVSSGIYSTRYNVGDASPVWSYQALALQRGNIALAAGSGWLLAVAFSFGNPLSIYQINLATGTQVSATLYPYPTPSVAVPTEYFSSLGLGGLNELIFVGGYFFPAMTQGSLVAFNPTLLAAAWTVRSDPTKYTPICAVGSNLLVYTEDMTTQSLTTFAIAGNITLQHFADDINSTSYASFSAAIADVEAKMNASVNGSTAPHALSRTQHLRLVNAATGAVGPSRELVTAVTSHSSASYISVGEVRTGTASGGGSFTPPLASGETIVWSASVTEGVDGVTGLPFFFANGAFPGGGALRGGPSPPDSGTAHNYWLVKASSTYSYTDVDAVNFLPSFGAATDGNVIVMLPSKGVMPAFDATNLSPLWTTTFTELAGHSPGVSQMIVHQGFVWFLGQPGSNPVLWFRVKLSDGSYTTFAGPSSISGLPLIATGTLVYKDGTHTLKSQA